MKTRSDPVNDWVVVNSRSVSVSVVLVVGRSAQLSRFMENSNDRTMSVLVYRGMDIEILPSLR